MLRLDFTVSNHVALQAQEVDPDTVALLEDLLPLDLADLQLSDTHLKVKAEVGLRDKATACSTKTGKSKCFFHR